MPFGVPTPDWVQARRGAISLKSAMKIFIRYFFRGVRTVLGPVMLLKETLTRPKALARATADQAKVDAACQDLALYQYQTCPFCIKVRQEMHRLALPKVQRIDAQHPGAARTEPAQHGGQAKVPCLKITQPNGDTRWLYDSEKIISYLRVRFAPEGA